MKTTRLFPPLLVLALASAVAHAKLEVVATLPDFADIARQIGGDAVNVTCLAKPGEDAHFVVPKPSFIRTLNKADLLIEGGADLEAGWLPPLVAQARNAKISPGGPARLSLANAVEVLDVPTGPVDRSGGDVHPRGNPHFWLDPVNGKRIAAAITTALSQADPADAAAFQKRLAEFDAEMDRTLASTAETLKPFAGTKVVTYHRSFDYLLRRYGLQLDGTLEPKPGIEPSPAHINDLTARMKADGVKLILIEPFRPRKTAEQLAAATGAKLVVLPDKSGADDATDSYAKLFARQSALLAAALGKSP